VDGGYREIVLTGIHLGHYGVDWNRYRPKEDWMRLSHLVRSLAELPGEFRVRLSSIEATEVTRELIDVMSENQDKICPHLHISMQSGSDGVLRRMRRRWGSRRFVDRCQLLQHRLDRPAITTDVIVGFPGESDDEFAETVDVCRQVGFSKIHIFPFSARRGTPAAQLPDQLSKQIKQARGRELAAVEEELRNVYFARLRGIRLRVLVESEDASQENNDGCDAGRYVGTSCRYAPVVVEDAQAQEGEFVDVLAGDVQDGRLMSQSVARC
jgi:threonylcarbamoyladenosine tRNA methylthiotransferase MtaB